MSDFAVSVSSGLTVIERQTPSGVSEAAFTSGIDSDHDTYILAVSGLVPASDGVQLQLQVSNDGGSSWQSGASAYGWALTAEQDNGASQSENNGGDSVVRLADSANGLGSAAGESYGGAIWIHDPQDVSLFTNVDASATYFNVNGQAVEAEAGGAYKTAEAIDGVRLKMSSGNIEDGTVVLLGVA